MTIKQFKILALKNLSNNISEDEKVLLKTTIDNSIEYKNKYELIEQLWNSSQIEKPNADVNIDSEWEILQQKLQLDEVGSLIDKGKKGLLFSYWKPAFAATIIAIIMITFFITRLDSPIKPSIYSVATQKGETKLIELVDGSTINLNNDSYISYDENYGKTNRNIMLRGEAFFSVTKDKLPFIVQTHNAQTKVLGTQFNINAWDEVTDVVVKRGLVNLSSLKSKEQSVNISKGMESVATKDTKVSIPVDVDINKKLSWLDGKLLLENATPAKVAEKLGRFYNIKVKTSADLNNDETVTGTFNRSSADSTLQMICLALNIKFKKDGNVYYLTE